MSDTEEVKKAQPIEEDDGEIQMFDDTKKKKKDKKDKKDKKEKKDKKAKKEQEEEIKPRQSLLVMEGYREYQYDELLDRVINELKSKNPNLSQKNKAQEREDPYVVRVGTTKSCWTNFASMSETINRKPEHLMSFVSAELGADCRLGGEQQLIVAGKFSTKIMEKLYKKYIENYVTCSNCRSPSTLIEKDPSTRLYMMTCQNCGATKSVAQIKAGFHVAKRGERRKARQ
jgi:translation initiation factor 2 subunit 2